ncbi:short-chain dehydrogenase/reductase SDR [Mycolicibacterium rhodesiae JS60]|nr:short-chain dehydrogenase/reductase SDR [Mycolicibacterium rhodesiae JS60]
MIDAQAGRLTLPLAGKRIVVTGAGAGLGRAYAVYAGANGADVVVNDLDPTAAAAVADDITSAGGSAVSIGCSVADWDAATSIVELCVNSFGGIDGLVNNAGVHRVEQPWLTDEDTIRSIVTVNLMGSAFVGVQAMKRMVDKRHGSIVNITSSAQLGLTQLGVYGATKGALSSLTYSWAIDLRDHGVRVNAYSPVAETAMTVGSPIPLSGIPTPEQNAPIVGYLLSDLSADVTGQVIQRRGDKLVVMTHPDLSEFAGPADADTIDDVHTHFGPVLRGGLQPVGDPRVRQATGS